jgi:hypothetical protein
MKNGLQGATISVSWGYDVTASITLSPREWAAVKAGKRFGTAGDGYDYEGEFFQDYWDLEGGLDGKLLVTYSDSGVGFDGRLRDAQIEEYEPTQAQKATRTSKRGAAGTRAAGTKIRKTATGKTKAMGKRRATKQ